ncbi:MAG: type II secretion system minor pseudopilin GspI [Glaciecola sp.]|jgi:general secretion pathway protein I
MKHISQRRRAHARQRGLTLIEVMVALLIFGLAGTAILKAVADNLAAVSELRDITHATTIANNQLTRLKLSSQWPLKNNEKGDTTIGDVTWYWQQHVIKTQADDIVQVRVKVSREANIATSITDVTTFMSKPIEVKQ